METYSRDGRTPVRLTFGDDLFMRRHRSLGSPVVCQFVWRFDQAVPRSTLIGLRDALADGALSRRVDRSVVPGARDRWSRVAHRPELMLREPALQEHEVIGWIRRLAASPLDPGRGDAWRLASAELVDGSGIVVLLLDHAVADGAAVVDAFERAASGQQPLTLPARPPLVTALASDVRDSATQVAAVGRWLGTRPWRRRTPPGPRPDTATDVAATVSSTREVPAGWVVPLVVAECRTADIETTAARHGGTLNAWFVSFAGSVAASAGVAGPGRPLKVALPVSVRAGADLRANLTKIAQVELDLDEVAARDLAGTRARCKRAYAALGTTTLDGSQRDPGSLLTLVQMLPDAVLRRLPRPPATTVLASNLGSMSEAFSSIGGVRARSIGILASQRENDLDELRAMGGALTAWATTAGERTTVTIAALDPEQVPDDAALGDLVTKAFADWGIEAQLW